MKDCKIPKELMDEDYCALVFEFSMNYSLDNVRYAYGKAKEDEKKQVNADKLRKLGYSEEQIKKARV